MNSATKIRHRTGSEGPEFDLYAFDEWTVERNGETTKIHLGLAQWVQVNNGIREQYREPVLAVDRFAALVGFPFHVITSAYFEQQSRCQHCGCKQMDEVDGYPGETLSVCVACGEIAHCDFDESAVI